jgi:glycosyltransferase involved in cell wall biosynthesis
MNFSLIIPCFNESKNIPILIKKYQNFLKDKKNELILVNNGSKDDTDKIIKKYLRYRNIRTFNVKKNIGFGYGLKKGIMFAGGKVIIYSHADLEVNPKDVMKSISIYNKNNFKKKIFIKGNRINKLKNHWSLLDIFFSYSLTLISSILFQKKIFDIHAMPVLFSNDLKKKIGYYPNDFSIDLSIYLAAKKNDYKIIRFPVNFNKKKRRFGEGSSDSLKKKFIGSCEQLYQLIVIIFKPN